MSNGRLTKVDSGWVVSDLKPHISIAFKSMFRGFPIGALPPFVVKDTPQSAADLEWFMFRHPLDMDSGARDHLAGKLTEHEKIRCKVEELKRPDYQPTLKSGFKEPEKPEPYQVKAAEMLQSTGYLLLMDDVGLGKTVSFLASVAGGWGLPAAVVVQPHLSGQWVKQYIERFTNLTAVEVRDRKVRSLPPADIYIFRYSNIASWADYAETLGIKTVCFDEIQELRHGRGTDKGRGANAFCKAADYRIGLTATPIYNYGSEIWNVVEFIAPGALGGWYEFLHNWCIQNGSHWVVKDPSALGSFLLEEGIALRRTNEHPEVSKTLPPLEKHVLEVAWNDTPVQANREEQRALAIKILNGSFYERGQAARQLDMLMRQDTGIAKAGSVAAYVRALVEGGERVLLGGWHREVYRIWNEALSDLNPVMFTGSETQAQKNAAKKAFISGESPILIMSLRSGAGLDGLQHSCAHVVFGEFDWSPQVHTQFTGRVRRRGQSRPVTAHYLHVDGGSDPVVMSTLGLKASQSHGILNPFADLENASALDEGRMRRLAKSVLEAENG